MRYGAIRSFVMLRAPSELMDALYLLVGFAAVVGVIIVLLSIELDLPLPRLLRRLAERGVAVVIVVAAVVTVVMLLTLAGIDAAIVDD